MEQHRDEHIDCADCGASFVFSADEAAVFAGRGLAAPKRCKDCRRARKERAANEGQGGQRRPAGSFGARDGNHAPRSFGNGPSRGAPSRPGAPARRYTGDVNEYRSPMQDGFSGSPHGMAARSAPRQGSDEYRSPMPDGFNRRPAFRDGGALRSSGGLGREGGGPAGVPRGPRPQAPGGGAPRFFREDRSFGTKPRAAGRPPASPPEASPPIAEQGAPTAHPAANKRRRPQAEMFSVTCDACGAQAEVPFKPAEGREVYCPTCYRARRPA